jgi:hypothetical protein
MMEQIFIGGIKKDFLKNIKRIANEMGVPEKDVQIRLKFGSTEEKPILYAICKNYALVKESTFKEIMDVTLDLKGREIMLTPPLYETMKNHCIGANCERIEDFSAFLFIHDNQIGVAMYNRATVIKVTEVSKLFS